MPTAAKLAAAIAFGIVAVLAAFAYIAAMPEGRPSSGLPEVSGVIGVLCGWFIMGPFAHRTQSRIDAMGTGLRTSVTIVVFVLVIFASVEMMKRAIKGRYDTPMEAILSMFELAIDLSRPLASPNVLGVLLLGGLIGGAVSHWTGRRWP